MNTRRLLICIVCAGNIQLALTQSNDAKHPELPQADKDLFDALKEEDVERAAEALKAGANINALSPRGQQTPLMQSVLHGRTKMVEWCLDHGADVTIGERDGYTPMHGAGFQGRLEIAEVLLKYGVGLRDVHKDGHEPIIRSCWGSQERHTALVAWFLDNGVPVDEIYDKCIHSTKNASTKQLLQQRKASDDDDDNEDDDNNNSVATGEL